MHTVYLTLKLDEILETAVRVLWQRLHAAGLSAPGPGSLRPHITLAGYDQVEPADFASHLQKFTHRRQPLPVEFNHLGIFPPKRVLFLAAHGSRQLMRLHQELLQGLQTGGYPPVNNRHFQPEQWIPHCSLLIETSMPGLQRGVALSAEQWQPLQGQAVGIGLVIFPEKKDHLLFPFQSQ